MDIRLREYKNEDYVSCEHLVSEAWGFDQLFASENLRQIARCSYTKGSLVSSNYRMVATHQGRVIGFIFGFNKSLNKKTVNALLLGLRLTFDLNFKKMDKAEKSTFVEALKEHHKNRSKIAAKKSNEIVLFVISPDFQGVGIGQNLWLGFKEFCAASGERTIRVETNKIGASSFYEKLGFHHLADFDSPLHNLATGGGQACLYEYVQKQI